jgi:hypothetical protein
MMRRLFLSCSGIVLFGCFCVVLGGVRAVF